MRTPIRCENGTLFCEGARGMAVHAFHGSRNHQYLWTVTFLDSKVGGTVLLCEQCNLDATLYLLDHLDR